MMKLPLLFLGGFLLLLSGCHRHPVEPEMITIIEIPSREVDKDFKNRPLKSKLEIKAFIYSQLISNTTGHSGLPVVCRLSRESDFDAIAKQLQAPGVSFESSQVPIDVGGPDQEPLFFDGKALKDGLDHSWEYRKANNVHCFRIKDFDLPDGEFLSVYVGTFRNMLEASGQTFLFKRVGDAWFFCSGNYDWIS